uniref:Uncharacterized protein n=1 Tax=Kwoniella dejecticola CBS 10117 TaxID=1296121 RepID=A0A1A6AF71_9TREE|nr:uncharacterized protein I303_00523 [Kwoniella dejecticola CBS 10117]OBR88706.1 hypothetical protein I303_00523 [Kwoniella dejecticola CBS 10117]
MAPSTKSTSSSDNIPSLSHTAATSVTNSMPVSPRTASPGPNDQKPVITNGEEVKQEKDEKVDMEELVQEIKEDGETDPQLGTNRPLFGSGFGLSLSSAQYPH